MRSTEYKPWKGWLSKLLNIRLNTTKSGAKPGLPLGHDAGSLHQIPSYLMAILVLRTQRLYSSVHPFIHPSVHPPVHPSVHLFILLSL